MEDDGCATSGPLHILMLEDLEADAELCRIELERGGVHCEVRRVDRGSEFERALVEAAPDLILCDFSMPGAFDGFAALEMAKARVPDAPFIFVAGLIGTVRAVEAVKRGAADCILKKDLSRLVPAVRRALADRHRPDAPQRETHGRAGQILASLVDVVWSFAAAPERVMYINDATEAVWGRPAADFYADPGLWLALVHPDDRDRVREAWSRTLAGEVFDIEYRVLSASGGHKWLHNFGKPALDEAGKVVRVDGLARDVTQRRAGDEQLARAARLRSMLAQIDTEPACPGENRPADRRMDEVRLSEVLELERQLRRAIDEEQFVLHYQPRISFTTGQVCGLEALMRWASPDLGLVRAGHFIPLLEASGLIVEVGLWALRRAAADASAWRAAGVNPPSIGVNVSPIQLRRATFVEDALEAIGSGGACGAIEIEVTESALMSELENNARKLDALQKAGVRIALDDFGTGYSSLSYLAHLPADLLKISRSFVCAMTTSPAHMSIVTTIISLARNLKLRAVAEGVETDEEARLLHLLRCDEGQGYLYSCPVPAEDVGPMLDRLDAHRHARAASPGMPLH